MQPVKSSGRDSFGTRSKFLPLRINPEKKRRECNISRQELKFNSISYEADRTKKIRIASGCKKSRNRIIKRIYYGNKGADHRMKESSSNQMKENERFYDNESIAVSSLLTVPKGNYLPVHRVAKSFDSKESSEKMYVRSRNSRKPSIGCLTVSFYTSSEEYDFVYPSQPRYSNN